MAFSLLRITSCLLGRQENSPRGGVSKVHSKFCVKVGARVTLRVLKEWPCIDIRLCVLSLSESYIILTIYFLPNSYLGLIKSKHVSYERREKMKRANIWVSGDLRAELCFMKGSWTSHSISGFEQHQACMIDFVSQVFNLLYIYLCMLKAMFRRLPLYSPSVI